MQIYCGCNDDWPEAESSEAAFTDLDPKGQHNHCPCCYFYLWYYPHDRMP